MKKTFYIKPELDIIVLNENLLDTLPKDSLSYEDDSVLSKPNSWFDEEESSDIKQQNFSSVWDDD